MLVRSPMFTNKDSGVILKASKPERRQAGAITGIGRGAIGAVTCAIWRMCSGVEPQQPPTRLTRPDLAKSSKIAAISSAVWSYSPKALGKPALGCAETCVSAKRDNSSK